MCLAEHFGAGNSGFGTSTQGVSAGANIAMLLVVSP